MTITEGDDATFAIEASGEGLSYAWLLQDIDGSIKQITDATGNTLTLTDVSYEFNGTQVYCVVTSTHGEQAESLHATLTVEPKPLVITSDLSDVSVTEGGSVTLDFGVEGDVDQYTWYLQKPDDTVQTTTSEENSYTISDIQKSLDGSTVWCVATGIHGQTIESSKIKLMVLDKPADDSTTRSDYPKDSNRDGVTTCSEAYGSGWIWDENQGMLNIFLI